MNNGSKVTAIIPTFNRARLLDQALWGMLAQTRKIDSILVVDDGSSDDTANVVSRYDGQVGYLALRNGGKALALNVALEFISSGYVWVFDDDDWPLPNALDQLLEVAAGAPEGAFVYSGYFTFAGNKVPRRFDKAGYHPPAVPFNGSLFLRALQSFPFHQNGMLVPLECYRQLGGYDERLARGQDYDMIIRLCRHYHGVRLDEPTFAQRQHDGLRGPLGELHNEAERAQVWFHYDQLIFRTIRETVSLVEYMTPMERGSDECVGQNVQMARLRRASIMAQHGLLQEAVVDVRQSLRFGPLASSPDYVQGMAFLGRRPHHDVGSLRFLLSLAWTAARGGWADGLRPVLRGAYWDLRTRVKRGSAIDAACLAVVLPVMLVVGSVSIVLVARAGATPQADSGEAG